MLALVQVFWALLDVTTARRIRAGMNQLVDRLILVAPLTDDFQLPPALSVAVTIAG